MTSGAAAEAARKLSRELRLGRSNDLRRRRWMVGLSLIGAAMGKIVGLYQVGILRRLPDLPLKNLDATKVDASPYAFKRMRTPDGFLMIASYAFTAILAAAGGRDRHKEEPHLPIALAGKAFYDVYVALKLRREEWEDNHAHCGYCQTATLASFATLALSLPEAVKAVRHVVGR